MSRTYAEQCNGWDPGFRAGLKTIYGDGWHREVPREHLENMYTLYLMGCDLGKEVGLAIAGIQSNPQPPRLSGAQPGRRPRKDVRIHVRESTL